MKNEVKLTLIVALAVPLSGSWCAEDPPAGGLRPPPPPRPRDGGGLVEGAPEAEAPELEVVRLDASTVALSGWLDAHEVDASIEDAGPLDAEPFDAAIVPRVFWVSPANGAHLVSASLFVMGTENFVLVPAHRPSATNQGHLHVLVDLPCNAPGDPFPRGLSEVVDLSEAQFEVRLVLPAGPHTLCLQAGTSGHVALPLTDVLTVLVQ